jgi:hypothetical protein
MVGGGSDWKMRGALAVRWRRKARMRSGMEYDYDG